MQILVRFPKVADEEGCVALARKVLEEDSARAFIASHFREHRIVVAEAEGAVVGLLAWRTDWFASSFATWLYVEEKFRRRGAAREMFLAVEHLSPGPRIFSSCGEDDAGSIRMHHALGFVPSGHVDNLPRGKRELIFFKSIPPKATRTEPAGPARN